MICSRPSRQAAHNDAARDGGVTRPREVTIMLARICRYGISTALLLSLLACGGGGGGGGDAPAAPANVAGTWNVTETSTNNNCGDPGDPPYSITIAQSGSNLTVTTPSGVFTGSISGNIVRWTGSYPDDGGTTTITALTATVSGNSFSGSSSWTWAGPGGPCSGSTNFTGTRAGGGGGGTQVNEIEPNNSRATGQTVTRPVTVTGSVSELDAGETPAALGFKVEDWYRFTLTGTATVTITLTHGLGSGFNDLDLVLMQGDTFVNGMFGVTGTETITGSLPAGTYQVGVLAFDTPSGSVTYTLSIQ
jgi:hypothetical protein